MTVNALDVLRVLYRAKIHPVDSFDSASLLRSDGDGKGCGDHDYCYYGDRDGNGVGCSWFEVKSGDGFGNGTDNSDLCNKGQGDGYGAGYGTDDGNGYGP